MEIISNYSLYILIIFIIPSIACSGSLEGVECRSDGSDNGRAAVQPGARPAARAHRSLLQLSIFGLSATDKKGFQNTGR